MAEAAPSVWTEDRLKDLRRLWAEGLSITQIGLEIGLSRNAVVGKVHRLGLPKRISPIKQKPRPAEIIDLASLRPGMCSWPEGEPGKDDFHFCGSPNVPGKPYCVEHCRRAYVKTTRDGRKTRVA